MVIVFLLGVIVVLLVALSSASARRTVVLVESPAAPPVAREPALECEPVLEDEHTQDIPRDRSGRRNLGRVQYSGPPFGVDIVYIKDTWESQSTPVHVGPFDTTIVSSRTVGTEESRRRVRVDRIHGHFVDKPKYVVGFCYLRQDIRAFRVDRIRELTETAPTRPAASPEWLLRCRIADARGTPPRVREGERILLADKLDVALVVHEERRSYDFTLQRIERAGEEGLAMEGAAVLRPQGRQRPWSGRKTFLPAYLIGVETPSGEAIADPQELLWTLAGFGDVARRPCAKRSSGRLIVRPIPEA